VLSKGFNASFLWKWKEFDSKYCSKLDHDAHERPWTPKLFRQKSIAHSIKSELPFDSGAIIQRRLSTFFEGGSFEHRIHQLPLIYKHHLTLLGPKFISCHLRTICNQWCSRRRFGGRTGKCVFQCANGDDDIDHSITCPLFSALAVKKLRLRDELISLEPLLLFSLGSTPLADSDQRKILVYVHLCFNAYNMCRHGKKFSGRLFNFLWRKTMVRMKKGIFLGGWSGGLDGTSMAGPT